MDKVTDMHRFLFPALFALCAALATGCVTGGFSDGDYGKVSHQNYDRGAFNKRIDFNNVNYTLLNAAVFYETNRARARAGLKPFEHSPVLGRASAAHSRDMVDHDFYGHDSPVRGRRTLEDRLTVEGLKGALASENVGWAFGLEYEPGREVFNPEQNGGYWSYSYKGPPIPPRTYAGMARFIVAFWMNNPADRGNITNPGFTHLGVGSAQYEKPELPGMPHLKFTQNFANRGGN